MTIAPRILLFSIIGIFLYLGLSLYHGHRLRNYAEAEKDGGKALSARAQEKNWVQVTTTGRTSGRTDPPGQTSGRRNEAGNGAAGDAIDHLGRNLSDPPPENNAGKDAAGDDPKVIITALQTELLQTRGLLQAREEELREARLRLDTVLAEKKAVAGDGGAAADRHSLSQQKQERMAADRLNAELREVKTRAAIAEDELERARLKAEAMFRYGQEQNRLLAAARQEAESLAGQLGEARDRLRRMEEDAAALLAQEQKSDTSGKDRPSSVRKVESPSGAAEMAPPPTPPSERAD